MQSVDIPGKELQGEYDAALAKCSEAEVAAHNVGAEIDLIAPPEIRELEAIAHDKATSCEKRNENEFLLARSRLRIAMRYHLQGHDIPEYGELSKQAEKELSTKALFDSGQHILWR